MPYCYSHHTHLEKTHFHATRGHPLSFQTCLQHEQVHHLRPSKEATLLHVYWHRHYGCNCSNVVSMKMHCSQRLHCFPLQFQSCRCDFIQNAAAIQMSSKSQRFLFCRAFVSAQWGSVDIYFTPTFSCSPKYKEVFTPLCILNIHPASSWNSLWPILSFKQCLTFG